MFSANTGYFGRIYFTVFVVLAWFMLLVPSEASAREQDDGGAGIREEIIRENISSEGIRRIEQQLGKYSGEDIKNILTGFNPENIIKDGATGKFNFNFPDVFNGVVFYLLKEIYLNAHILLKLMVLIVLCAVLKNLQASFLSDSVGELAFFACYIAVVSVMIVGFNTAMELGKNIIDKMVSFMQATVPVLIALLVSGGNISSAGIFQPILIMIVQIGATLIKNILIPLVYLSTVLSVIDNISDKVQVSRLAGLLKQVCNWTLGIILTVFIGVVSVQGSLGAVVDGVASKTAKFAIGAMIPVAGKYLADAADTVVGCTLLIKNAAGVAVMAGIIAICLVPLLKIFAVMALYKIACVLAEPISEKRVTNCINDISGSLMFIVGIVASVAIMFLILVTAIISAGNISAMMR